MKLRNTLGLAISSIVAGNPDRWHCHFDTYNRPAGINIQFGGFVLDTPVQPRPTALKFTVRESTGLPESLINRLPV